MLALTVLTLMLPAQERADSFCPRNFIPGPAEMSTWILDDDLASQLTTITVRGFPDSMPFAGDPRDSAPAITDRALTNDDLLAMTDRILQGFARRARIRVQTRVVLGECAPGSDRCITGVSDGFDRGDDCEDSPDGVGVAAFAGCDVFGCAATICEEMPTDWTLGTLEGTLTHELGHAFGLSHPDEQDNIVCTRNSDCATGTCNPLPGTTFGLCSVSCLNFDTHNTDFPSGCGNGTGDSDGCGGEVMCSTLTCNAGWYLTSGDQVGLRTRFPSSPEERSVFLGAEALPIEALPTFTDTGRNSFFPPRIDCAKGATPTNQCAMVVTGVQSSGSFVISVVRLDGFGAGNVFNTMSAVNSLILPATEAPAHPPDIAVNADGTVAWVTFTAPGRAGEVHVLRVDLGTGDMLDLDLNYGAVLPPRVVFNTDLGLPVVIALRNSPGSNESFGRPVWRLTRIAANNTVSHIDDFWNDGNANTLPAGEFDVDCESATGTDDCVVVSQRFEATAPVDSMWSRRFSLTAAAVTPAASWSLGNFRNNGIIGVAVTSEPRLLISAGRAVLDGTTTSNTRIVERSRFDFASSGAVADDINRSDAVSTCRTGSHGGLTLPAATMHGGYSWAFCPSCTTGSGVQGRLLSLHFGLRNDGDTFCY